MPKRHFGRIKNTDRRCVVVMMQIPQREDHALIVDTDALPDRLHDGLMEVVESLEGQQTPVLANILTRRIYSDLQTDIMTALHQHGFLQPVSIDNIVMYPEPNHPVPLRSIVNMMTTTETVEADPARDNRIVENQTIAATESVTAVARGLLMQAADLEAAGRLKREEAYRMAPQLRPTEKKELTPEAVLDALQGSYEPTPAGPVAQQGLESPAPTVINLGETVDLGNNDALIVEQIERSPERKVYTVDTGNMEPDVAAAYIEAIKAEFQERQAAHAITPTDDRMQDFLDKAAARADKAAKAAEPVVKRPVGRPRKNAG
jgi:hypothetical protein